MKIAIIGKMHSGKSSAIQHFMALSGLILRSQVLIKFADPLYQTQNLFTPRKHRVFLQSLSDLVKKHFGESILNEQFIRKVQKLELDPSICRDPVDVFCDDVRVLSELKTVQNLGFITVGITASDEVRKARCPELFTGLDHITEKEIDHLFLNCDHLVDNNSSIQDLYNNLNTLYFSWD